MMVRPLNAAKPATTSRRSALSHVTVMRAACDCALSDAWAARYASMLEPSPLCAGVATRAAWPPRPAARCATGGTTAAGGALATDGLDHAVSGGDSPPPRACARGQHQQERDEGCDALHGVTSCLASCRLSCRSKPNSCTVNTISRGRIVVALRRPMMLPGFTRYTLLLVTSRSTATLRAGYRPS